MTFTNIVSLERAINNKLGGKCILYSLFESFQKEKQTNKVTFMTFSGSVKCALILTSKVNTYNIILYYCYIIILYYIIIYIKLLKLKSMCEVICVFLCMCVYNTNNNNINYFC